MPAPAANTTLTRLRSATAIITSLSLFITQSAAYALPVGGQVVAGQATISTSPNALTVNQSSNRAILNWQGFNIGSGETVNVVEPSAASIELERVSGSQNPSQIMGSLSSNGQVWLVSPGGVMFGSSAQVNVAGLVATSSDVDNNSFMNGIYSFTHPGNPNALISNAGSITISDNGLAALVGPNVTNSGLIQAKLGKVALASGDTFALDLYGDGLINLQASSQITQQVVSNSGSIKADGGTVLLTAAAAQGAINSVINMTGLIQANSVGTQNGTITLYAEGSNAVPDNIAADKGQKQGNSEVLVSGTLDATGYAPGQTGGSISVLGDHVGILAGSTIDASGDAGGGTIKVGGDFHGQGTTPTAEATIVQSGATILANAIIAGSGGNVTVWADDTTNFAGTIQANGGANGGNGGFIETSGHVLAFAGTGSASAPNGTAGTWLLDPNNVTIDANPTSNPSPFTASWTSTGASDVLYTDIQSFLNAGTNVDITASGTIEVAHNLTKSAGADATLTLAAGTDITVDTGIAIAATTGKLNVILDADTALGGGAIVMNSGSSITSNGGNITLGGQGSPLTTAAVGDAASSGIGININDAILSSGSGNIIMNGTGQTSGTNTASAYGIEMQAGAQANATGNGTITMNGIGGGSGNGGDNIGVYLTDSGTDITVINGNLSITGTAGGGSGLSNHGIFITTNAVVQTTGTGSITLTGTGGETSGSAPDIGVVIYSGADVKSTATGGGGITVIGYSGANADYGGGGFGAVYLEDSTISSVTGNIVIDANTGTTTGQTVNNSSTSNNNYGIDLFFSSILSTGSANITLNGVGTGSGSSTNDYGIYIAVASNVIGGASATGNITLTADTISLANTTIQTSGNVRIEPYTASTSIGVAGGAGMLGLTSSYLGDINAGSITIGNAADSGTMNVGSYAWANPLTLDSGSGNINITNGAGALAFTHALTINTGSGNVTLAATTDISNTAATNITTGIGGGTGGSVTFDSDSANGGAGAISLTGGTITSNGGNITLGGQGSPATLAAVGDVASSGIGINLNAAILNAGSGNISLIGTGYTGGVNTSNAFGVEMQAGAQANATGNGTITITGIGGGTGSGGNNSGVFLDTSPTQITVVNGALSITGTGGSTTGNSDEGVNILSDTMVQTTGSGTIAITGYGGGSGGSSFFDAGIQVIVSNNAITSTATGGGGITMIGYSGDNGGSTTDSTYGIDGIVLYASTISSVTGAISLNGNTGNGHAVSNSSGSNYYGLAFEVGSTVSSTGNATITLNGVGAGSGSSEFGIFSGLGGSNVIGGASAGGTIAFNANTVSLTNFAAQTTGNVTIAPTTPSTPIGFSGGAGTLLVTQAIMDDINAPTVTIGAPTDTGLLTTGAFNWEHTLNNLNLESGGAAGAVTIGGAITKGIDDGSVANIAGGTLNVIAGADIIVNSNKAISSSSTYGQLNTIFDADYAGSGGAILMNSGSSISSNGGNITMGGQGSPATLAAVGDVANGGAAIVLAGGNTLNAGAGNITLLGSGISGNKYSAISMLGGSNLIETTSGAITIDAQDTQAEFGRYTLNIASGTTITSNTGSITLSGSTANIPNSQADLNMIGLAINSGVVISSTGSGSNVGAITLTGIAHPNGGYYTFGLTSSGAISSVDGNISLTGTDSSSALYTPAGGSNNLGLYLIAGSITSTGNGAIRLVGTGDINNTSNNDGLVLVATVSAHNGSITMQGTGGGYGSAEEGIYVGASVLSTGTAPITMTGIGVNGSADIDFTSITIGGGSDIGAITFNANTLDGSNPTIQTTNNVTFSPNTTSTTIGISGGAGTLGITSGLLSGITAGSLTIGSTSGTGNITVGTQTLPDNELIETGSGNIEFSGAQTDGTKTLTAVTTSGNITLDQNAKIASTASGNAIVLADSGGNFINNDTNDGTSALSTPDGRWLVYSNNPFDNTLNGLTSSFNRYFCTYGGTCPSFSPAGDGLLYSLSDFPVTSYTVDSNVNLPAYNLPAATAGDRAKTPIGNLLTVDFDCWQPGGSADAFTVNCQGDNGR